MLNNFDPSGGNKLHDASISSSTQFPETSQIIALIEKPLSKIRFKDSEEVYQESEVAKEYRKAFFLQNILEKKLASLTQKNPSGEYRILKNMDELSKINRVIFEGKEPKENDFPLLIELISDKHFKLLGWDGDTINMPKKDFISSDNGIITINTSTFKYSAWQVLLKAEYRLLQNQYNKPLSNAGIGISILVVTSDGHLVFTERPKEGTPVYPGRFHVVGGGPTPDQTPLEAAIDEIKEELGIIPGKHFDPEKIMALGLAYDLNHQEKPVSRAELLCSVHIEITAAELQAIFKAKLSKPLDVSEIRTIPLNEFFEPNYGYSKMSTTMSDEAQEVLEKIIPPASATLSLFRVRELESKR